MPLIPVISVTSMTLFTTDFRKYLLLWDGTYSWVSENPDMVVFGGHYSVYCIKCVSLL